MDEEIQIVLLEDSADDAEMILYHLRQWGLKFQCRRVETEEEFQRALDKEPPDLILSDYRLRGYDGFAALALARRKHPEIPFIFVTGMLGEEVVIETLKQGATDYVLKSRLSRLVPAVQRALRAANDRAERKRAEEKLRQSHEQLRALTAYLQYVREEERTRISREVHDELGQALTGLKLDLSWIARRLPKESVALIEKAKGMASYLDATIRNVRRISTELRPGILDELGLVAAMEWGVQEFQRRTGIQCQVTSLLKEPLLDPELTTVFFRIFQEALTNIARHANATNVEVRLIEQEGNLILEVKDNGRGISEADSTKTKSIGLLGMRERAALLGGKLQVRGVPGRGTTVAVILPYRRREASSKSDHENSAGRRPLRRSAGSEGHPQRPV